MKDEKSFKLKRIDITDFKNKHIKSIINYLII